MKRKFPIISIVCIFALAGCDGLRAAGTPSSQRQFLDRYCVSCHSDKLKTGGISLQSADPAQAAAKAELWEKVIRKVDVEAMPPIGAPHPDRASRDQLIAFPCDRYRS